MIPLVLVVTILAGIIKNILGSFLLASLNCSRKRFLSHTAAFPFHSSSPFHTIALQDAKYKSIAVDAFGADDE